MNVCFTRETLAMPTCPRNPLKTIISKCFNGTENHVFRYLPVKRVGGNLSYGKSETAILFLEV